MKYLISLTMLIFLLFSGQLSYASDRLNGLSVKAIYQLDDDEDAGFEFFTRQKHHQCDETPSGRFRSYAREPLIAQRNFELVLSAFQGKGKLTVRTLDCEGKAMLVDQLGIQK